MPQNSQFFEDAEKLPDFFKDIELHKVVTFQLSGNSFAMEPCQWIAENILVHCKNLRKVNFSDIFTTRERKYLPPSLKFMIDAIIDKPIVELNLSHNAFGPDGVNAYEHFLERCPTLEVLNVTNCGLGPKGGEMIAQAILKNPSMRLREFSASRDRLENEGIKALSEVFREHKTLKKIEVYQNGIRMGLSHLFDALPACKDTLEYVDVSDNLIKRSTTEMLEFIKTCKKVKYFNLSDSLIKKKQQAEVVEAIVESLQPGGEGSVS